MAVDREDHLLAAQVAAAAGEELSRLRSRARSNRSELMDEADRVANTKIVQLLSNNIQKGDGLLTEESEDDLSRIDASRVWIIDPLDGTREFGEPPRSDWAVHVGLAVDGLPEAGAVSLPALGEVWSTASPRRERSKDDGVRVVVSRTRPPAIAEQVAALLGATLIPMGSAGAKTAAVLRGDADIYLHAGGQFEWDSCAPVAVALAAGFHASRLDGGQLRYNSPDPYLPDLLVCHPDLAERALAAVAEADYADE